MTELGDSADFAKEAVEPSGTFHDPPAHHLQDLVAAQQLIMGQVDDAHAPAAEFAKDLVVGVVGEARRERVGRGGALLLRIQSRSGLRPIAERSPGVGDVDRFLGATNFFEEIVRREFRDPIPAIIALFQMPSDRLAQLVVELTEAEGTERLG